MASSSSSSFQVSNHQLCQCDLQKPNATKKRRLWDWFDEELEYDWYRLQLNEMYYQLNPNQRCFLENEMSCKERIGHLQQEVNHGLARLTLSQHVIFW
nr:hypothetical protein [Tanacetum cinerariifolium]